MEPWVNLQSQEQDCTWLAQVLPQMRLNLTLPNQHLAQLPLLESLAPHQLAPLCRKKYRVFKVTCKRVVLGRHGSFVVLGKDFGTLSWGLMEEIPSYCPPSSRISLYVFQPKSFMKSQ